MAGAVDLFLVYQFVKRLATPFDKWDAYKQGIIDKEGNILKDKKERQRSIKDTDAFGKFDLLVLKMKKILNKLPGGSNRLGSYAAALWFIKEYNENDNAVITEDILLEYIEIAELSNLNKNFEQLLEEPTMSVGSGSVDGIGVGDNDEPGLTVSAMTRYKRNNQKKKRLFDIWKKSSSRIGNTNDR